MTRHRAAIESRRPARRHHSIAAMTDAMIAAVTASRRVVVLFAALAVGGVGAACAPEEPEPTTADTTAGYVSAMHGVCRSTDARLDALGSPPDDINPGDWAREVGLAFRAESESAGALVVVSSVGEQHRRLVRTTTDLAQAYADLADAIDTGGEIATLNTEIIQLSLGRDDLAIELDLPECARSSR